MSKSLAPIIKKYQAKRLKKDNPYAPQQIQFKNNREASQAVWEINASTGRECYNDGDVVNVYR
tara:strand:- start:109 stop:297 length:189 start_codon:yes stop_codon:yes gene_type:complete